MPEPFFSGSGLDRADLVRGDPAALAMLKDRDDAMELIWVNGLPAFDEDGRLRWRPAVSPDLFLGLDGEAPRFSAHQPQVGDVRAAFATVGLLDLAEAPTYAAALSLASWHSRHRFCANCGHDSNSVRGGWSRRCPSCSAEHFPRVDPVVIMLAEHGGDLLLGRQPHYPPNRYSALAGFVEVGETIEAAVAREFHEEAGIRVAEVAYVASQPWPFPSSLMIGCWARALDRDLTVDTTELEDARWFNREAVTAALAGDPEAPFLPPPKTAIARTLLEQWVSA
ncbi:MAG TPA: NAD(+) diphosphatase [Sphingomicrobium sp.]|nr:NAD(+) diphosphatase [Sphingomicrobium sp.]